MNATFYTPGGSSQTAALRFTCINSANSLNGHTLILYINNNGLNLYDATAGATLWTLT